MRRTRILGIIAAALTLTPWLVDCDGAEAQQRGMRKGKYICSVPGVGDLPLKTSRMLKDEHFFVYPTYGEKAQVSCEFSGSLQTRVWCPEGTVPANLNNLPPCLLEGQQSLKVSAFGKWGVDFDPNEEPGKRGLALSKEIVRLADLIKQTKTVLKEAEDQFNQECVQKAGDAKRCEKLKKDIDQYRDFLRQAPIEIEMLKEELMGLQFSGFDVLAKQCRESLRTISANKLSKVRPPQDKPDCKPLEIKEVEEQPALDEDPTTEGNDVDSGAEEPGDAGNPENPDAPGYQPGGDPQGRPTMIQIGDE